ncbi:MAG: hypothetical protein QF752_06150 [Planctomycetota bacterium]|nr:hypothetical protein [Planctomycetota bacterium]
MKNTSYINLRSFRFFLLGLCIIIGLLDILVLYVLRSNGTWSQLVPLSDLNHLDANEPYTPFETPDGLKEFYKILRVNVLTEKKHSIKQILEIQEFIGNQIQNCGLYLGPERGLALFKKGAAGAPLACGNLSEILQTALTAVGYKVRTIQLYRSDFASNETHVVVEAHVDGSWKIFDPTFNLTYENNGKLLGVQKVQELLNKNPNAVTPVFHGERKYPPRLDSYYMDWRPLFSNAYVSSSTVPIAWWAKLPPLRWWYGPKIYYFGDAPILWAKSNYAVLLVFVAIIPIALFMIFISFLVCIRVEKRRNGKVSKNPSHPIDGD